MEAGVSARELVRMGVMVHIPPALRSFTSGQDEVVMESRDAATLLRELDRAYPGIRGRILDETGKVRPYVNVFVNEELVRGPLEGVALAAGDAVYILPSVAGGTLG